MLLLEDPPHRAQEKQQQQQNKTGFDTKLKDRHPGPEVLTIKQCNMLKKTLQKPDQRAV